MKTITGYAAVNIKNAAKIQDELSKSGKTAEELPQATSDAFKEGMKLEGDKLTFMLNAVRAVSGRMNDLKRVVVLSLAEGENAPGGAIQIGDHYYRPEYYAPINPPHPERHGRGRRDGKGGKGGRDGKKPGGHRRDRQDEPGRREERNAGGPGGRPRDPRGSRGPRGPATPGGPNAGARLPKPLSGSLPKPLPVSEAAKPADSAQGENTSTPEQK